MTAVTVGFLANVTPASVGAQGSLPSTLKQKTALGASLKIDKRRPKEEREAAGIASDQLSGHFHNERPSEPTLASQMSQVSLTIQQQQLWAQMQIKETIDSSSYSIQPQA